MFAEEFAGASFAGGRYRVHDEQSGPRALASVIEAFPEFNGRVRPFGYDWLGRQFVIDLARAVGDQPLVLMLEPGTGEALEIQATFVGFHDEELIDYVDAVLATEFFGSWAAEHSDSMPLGRDLCVGYRVPLFLGGRDVIENLEMSDIDVYWSVCGQLRRGIRGNPPR